jgi:hypothetical protein
MSEDQLDERGRPKGITATGRGAYRLSPQMKWLLEMYKKARELADWASRLETSPYAPSDEDVRQISESVWNQEDEYDWYDMDLEADD